MTDQTNQTVAASDSPKAAPIADQSAATLLIDPADWPAWADKANQEAQEVEQERANDGPIREGWQITLGEGHSGYGVYAHMEEYPEEGAVLLIAHTSTPVAQRAIDLHEKAGMPWDQADELALSEAGISTADIDEMIGEHSVTVLTGFLPVDDVRAFVRGILVHNSHRVISGVQPPTPAGPLTDERILEEATRVGLHPGGIYADGTRFTNHNGHRILKLVRALGVNTPDGEQRNG